MKEVIIALHRDVEITEEAKEELEDSERDFYLSSYKANYWYWSCMEREKLNYVFALFEILSSSDKEGLFAFIGITDGKYLSEYGTPENFGLDTGTILKTPFNLDIT